MVVTKKKFAVSAVWKTLEQFSAKGISMVVSVILARLLSPQDYGLLALTAVFTNLSDILIDGGFSTALIRKDKVDEYDYSAVFSISSLLASVLYIIFFWIAPFVADYYNEPQLILVLRVVGLTFFIQSFTAVRNSIVNRQMQFKLLFYCNIIASLLSGVVGIIAAYIGLGVWALVIQRLVQQVVLTTILFVKVKWKIRWKFDFERIRQMLSFSIGVVGASLLNYLGGNIYNVVIGKKYSVTDLGYYEKGGQLPMQFSLYTFGAMSSVLLPTLSSCQSDIERVKHIVRKVVGMTAFLITPLMFGMAVTSKEIICLLFTDKWLPSVPIMQYSCIYYFATPFMLINVQVFFALGKSSLRVKSEVIRLALMGIALWVFGFVLNCSMVTLSLVCGIIAVIMSFVTYLDVRRLVEYSFLEVIKDIWKSIVSSFIMGSAVIGISLILSIDNIVIELLLKVITGASIYIIMVLILRVEEINDVIMLLNSKKNKKAEQNK